MFEVDCWNVIACQELQMDIQDHIASVDYINRTGAELHKKAPEEKAEKLKEDMESMNSRWTKVSNEIDQRVEKLEAAKKYFSCLEEHVENNVTMFSESGSRFVEMDGRDGGLFTSRYRGIWRHRYS